MGPAAAAATTTAGTTAKASSLANVANTATMVGTTMQGMPGTIDSWINLFGGKKRREKLFKEQLSQQDRLHALAYGYNEMSAEEAYRRQKEMYTREFSDNTPMAQRMRLEAAGFNPALMFGDMGGVGGANFPSSQQGGGASGASHATTPGEIEMARAANRQANAQLALTQSQARLNNAHADLANAEVPHTGAQTDLIRDEQRYKLALTAAQEFINNFNLETRDIQINQLKETLNKTISEIILIGVERQDIEQRLYHMWDKLELEEKFYALEEKKYKLSEEMFEWTKEFDPYKLEQEINAYLHQTDTQEETADENRWVEIAKLFTGLAIGLFLRGGGNIKRVTDYIRKNGKLVKTITSAVK